MVNRAEGFPCGGGHCLRRGGTDEERGGQARARGGGEGIDLRHYHACMRLRLLHQRPVVERVVPRRYLSLVDAILPVQFDVRSDLRSNYLRRVLRLAAEDRDGGFYAGVFEDSQAHELQR